MKHRPIALGFAAFAALSLTVACNVDPNRIDKDVDNTNLKTECASMHAISTDVLTYNRLARLDDLKIDATIKPEDNMAKTRNIVLTKGQLSIVVDSSTTESETNNNAIHLDITRCQVDQKAEITIPANLTPDGIAEVIVAKVDKVGTHKLELSNEDGSYVLEVIGAKAKMSEIKKDNMAEDGINQVRLTFTDKSGIVTVFISDSIPSAGDATALTAADVNLINDDQGSKVIENYKVKVKTQSSGKISEITGNVHFYLDELQQIAVETAGAATTAPAEILEEEVVAVDEIKTNKEEGN